jgi:uncharacterized protein YodC (DUF2158 family)
LAGEITFKVGDTVRLKSGGPRMTVTKMDERLVQCEWFEGTKSGSAAFPPAALEPFVPRPSRVSYPVTKKGL